MTKYLINDEEVHLIDGELWIRLTPVDGDDEDPELDNETESEEEEEEEEEEAEAEEETADEIDTLRTGHRTGRAMSPSTLCAIAALRDELTPQQVAGKCEISVGSVYQIKSKYKEQIEHGLSPTPDASDDKDDETGSDELSQDMIDQIQDLRDEDFTTSEIADELGLTFVQVAEVPKRSTRRQTGS